LSLSVVPLGVFYSTYSLAAPQLTLWPRAFIVEVSKGWSVMSEGAPDLKEQGLSSLDLSRGWWAGLAGGAAGVCRVIMAWGC